MNKRKKEKIAVLMSGGVDSSVAALLLKNLGFDLIGVHLKISKFCNPQDELDARLVAEKLNFPIYTLDISEDYQKKITLEVIKEYSMGFTPNPDVLCNSQIKFGLVLELLKNLNIKYLATGHYAKIIKFKNYYLLAGPKDLNKDQTYFLWQINKNNLKNIFFPIGGYLKSEVRQIASLNNLPNAYKKDSQGICFLGKIKLRNFLEEYLPIYKGPIMDTNNNILGYHSGYYFFTEGQRHGLNIKLGTGPYYVALKNQKKNTLIVAKENENILFSLKIAVKKINILVNKEILNKINKDNKIEILVRCRYRQPLVPAILDLKNKIVAFKEKIKNIALGQSAVFYINGQQIDNNLKGEIILLGGGVIIKKIN
ncbi:MAG: tRNA-specific 2-thiouridylase MnmA [Candidatus Parcubacteria bacterium]|nr:MAG: tRNA-specific 2-thiouridylase MnmA [Candidatus Parcubacteria bacterium]